MVGMSYTSSLRVLDFPHLNLTGQNDHVPSSVPLTASSSRFQYYLGLHQQREVQSLDYVPAAWFSEHTMLDALHGYVSRKMPVSEVVEALHKGVGFEVHGTYPLHAERVFAAQGYTHIKPIDFTNNPRQKKLNFVRPSFFEAKDPEGNSKLLVAVTPGSDYVLHYAEMLHYMHTAHKGHGPKNISVVMYPEVARHIAQWTAFDDRFVNPKDIVVIGYVGELRQRLSRLGVIQPISRSENDFYTSERYATANERTINFLGVKYSFWGNISTRLAHSVCQHGADALLKVGKAGVLTDPQDIYRRGFVPTRYLMMRKDQVVSTAPGIPNFFHATHSHLESGPHASVPTIMEESFALRDVAAAAGVQSIDNESGQMATIVRGWNIQQRHAQVQFGSLHFPTDYLFARGESAVNNSPNLSTDRQPASVKAKHAILDQMAVVLHEAVVEGRGEFGRPVARKLVNGFAGLPSLPPALISLSAAAEGASQRAMPRQALMTPQVL